MSTNSNVVNGLASELMPMSNNLKKSNEYILEKAKQLVDKLIQERGHDKPPFLPGEYARLKGIRNIIKSDLGKLGAVIIKSEDGFIIKVNKNDIESRQHFSCAHEIGHILFNELKLEQYIQKIEYRTFNPQNRAIVRAAARERLCDAAATELLMPESVFRKYLSGFGLSISSIEHLARVFRVSVQAAAIRIAEVSIDPCLALLWKPWPKNNPKGLRLAWCIGKGKNILPLQQLVKNSSKLYEAYKRDNPVKSSKVFRVDKDTKRLSMESKGFGYGETRYVISLAFLDK